jgi:F-type H+-transporting ATPase subunit gamma
MAKNGIRLVIGHSTTIMSQSHALQAHIGQLNEIRSILNAMKNLAFMEIHKLLRLQAMQNQALSNIEQAAMDFLSYNPELLSGEYGNQHTAIVVGSERGFCGDFNESLIQVLNDENFTHIIVIGNRLINKTAVDSHPDAIGIPGANIVEDVPYVIHELIETISSLLHDHSAISVTHSGVRLTAIYHDQETSQVNKRQIFPLNLQHNKANSYSHPPILNLEVSDFYAGLIHHYLFAVFHAIIYNALSAENHSRLQHLEAAVKHLDDDIVNLHRKLQTCRQEEITEEIEVILLNSEQPSF